MNKYLQKIAEEYPEHAQAEAYYNKLMKRVDNIKKGQGFTELNPKQDVGSATDPKIRKFRIAQPMLRASDYTDDQRTKDALNLLAAISRAHEGNEIIYGNRNIKNYKLDRNAKSAPASHYNNLNRGVIIDQFGNKTGQHSSLAVLGRESNDVRKLPLNEVKTSRILMRTSTGEAKLLKDITGKRYGIDEFTPEDLEKLDTAKPNSTSTLYKQKRKVFRVK